MEEKLKALDNELYQVDSESDKEKVKRPLTKLGNFLRQLGDEKSDQSKKLKGAKKVLENAQKLGRTYDKFSQWIPGLPRIPSIFLGKEKQQK